MQASGKEYELSYKAVLFLIEIDTSNDSLSEKCNGKLKNPGLPLWTIKLENKHNSLKIGTYEIMKELKIGFLRNQGLIWERGSERSSIPLKVPI